MQWFDTQKVIAISALIQRLSKVVKIAINFLVESSSVKMSEFVLFFIFISVFI